MDLKIRKHCQVGVEGWEVTLLVTCWLRKREDLDLEPWHPGMAEYSCHPSAGETSQLRHTDSPS